MNKYTILITSLEEDQHPVVSFMFVEAESPKAAKVMGDNWPAEWEADRKAEWEAEEPSRRGDEPLSFNVGVQLWDINAIIEGHITLVNPYV